MGKEFKVTDTEYGLSHEDYLEYSRQRDIKALKYKTYCEHCGEYENESKGRICEDCGCWICEDCDESNCTYEE